MAAAVVERRHHRWVAVIASPPPSSALSFFHSNSFIPHVPAHRICETVSVLSDQLILNSILLCSISILRSYTQGILATGFAGVISPGSQLCVCVVPAPSLLFIPLFVPYIISKESSISIVWQTFASKGNSDWFYTTKQPFSQC